MHLCGDMDTIVGSVELRYDDTLEYSVNAEYRNSGRFIITAGVMGIVDAEKLRLDPRHKYIKSVTSMFFIFHDHAH